MRATLTERVRSRQPDLDDQQVWQQVSWDPGERSERPGRSDCDGSVWSPGRTSASVGGAQTLPTKRTASSSIPLIFLAVEELAARQMMASHPLATGPPDAAWTAFAALIAGKAAEAGRRTVG